VHSYCVHGHSFDVPKHYNVVKLIGIGAYGVVCACVDNRDRRRVAIKKCHSVFRDVGDCKRVLREVKLLRFFHHENLLGLRSLFVSASHDRFQDVYIVTDLLDSDLNTVIRSKQKISDEHIRYFMYQLLRGLKYIHSAGVMHRDLKPANLLVNVNCDLQICDFGLARGIDSDGDGKLTDYVVTRWYRPPELLLMNTAYSTAVDIWSAGCIFAELANRRPLFMGRDYLAQIALICAALGTPDPASLTFLEKAEAVQFMETCEAHRKPALDSVVIGIDAVAVDFLDKMLQFDPSKRWSASQLMSHPYLSALHDETDEPVATAPFVWEFDGTDDISIEQLRRLFVEEMSAFPEDHFHAEAST
jgi:mitogen-activated protein kinase 1/3